MTSSRGEKRESWIDGWRGFAVLLMLETHCVNLLSRDMDGNHGWQQWLSFINGLAAPTFLWIAGYLQGKSIEKAVLKGQTRLTKARLRRLATILLWGILLQIPWQALFSWKWGWTDWRTLFQINILPCMTVSLMLLLVVGQVAPKQFRLVSLCLAITVIFLSPFSHLWQMGFLPLDAWLTHNHGSLFPLFPWFAFCALGLVMSHWRLSFKFILPLAALLMLVGNAIQTGSFEVQNPGFFMERLGWVLMLGILFKALMKPLSNRSPMIVWLQFVGRQSLWFYVMHLILLHALPIVAGSTLEQAWRDQLGWVQTGLVWLALIAICSFTTWIIQNTRPAVKAETTAPMSI